MTWFTPKTWVTDQVIDATDLNTHVRDNLNALKNPPFDEHVADEAADWSTSSTSFTDVDSTDLAVTITTTGGTVYVGFAGSVRVAAAALVYFDVAVNGTRHGGDDGIVGLRPGTSSGVNDMVSFVIPITGLSAGTYTFKLQWKTSASTVTLFAGAGTSQGDVHPQFWASEGM